MSTPAHKAIQAVADLASAYYDDRGIISRLRQASSGPPFPLTLAADLQPGDQVLSVAENGDEAPLVSVEEIAGVSDKWVTYGDGTQEHVDAVTRYLIHRPESV